MEIEVVKSVKVYEKLAAARIAFQGSGVKMSGKNTFAKYSYFELADILPRVNVIAQELGFVCVVSFNEIATLDFIDTESGDKVTFTSPMSSAALKGCHEVQNLGAVETYIKRYLYQNAFEIVESDALNMTHQKGGESIQEKNYKSELMNLDAIKNDPEKLAYISGQAFINEAKKRAILNKLGLS